MSAYGLSWPSRLRCVICTKFIPDRSPLWSVPLCLESACSNWRCCKASDCVDGGAMTRQEWVLALRMFLVVYFML
jgi:hypothetical protein